MNNLIQVQVNIYKDLVSSSSLQSTCKEAKQPKPSKTIRKRKNERYTEHQKDLLERAYLEQKLEDEEYLKKLASELDVTEKRVKSWNNNRKTKQRIDDEFQRLKIEGERYRIEVMRLSIIMSRCSSCNCHIRQRPPIQVANVTEPILPVNEASGNHVLPANPLKQPMELAPQGYFNENRQHDVGLLKSLPGVRNVCEAAYKEIMKLAQEAKLIRIGGIPELGSLKQPLQMFHDRPSHGMEKELTVEMGNIPLAPQNLISIMMDVEKWAPMLSNIVYRACNVFLSEPQQLRSIATEMKEIQMVNAELHLLTLILQTRRCQFLRFYRVVAPDDIWAIIDISDDYLFPTNCKPSLESRCRRNPSGLIIKKLNDNCSKVIWIENMEVSSSITSNSAFCAKKWMVTLLQSLNRKCGRNFVPPNVALKMKGPGHLLNLADLMRMAYFERVSWSPDESEWVITNDQDVRIMRKRTTFDLDALGLTTLYAAASFVLVAEPCWLFKFLSSKLHLQHLKMKITGVSEEICRIASNVDGDIIKLRKKGDDFSLEEVSMNDFCFYSISSPMSQSSFGFATPTGSWTGSPSIPSGFVILPLDGNGHQSACLVTIVASFDNLETSQANNCVTKFMKDIIAKTMKEVQETHQLRSRDLMLEELAAKGIMSF